MEAHTTGVRRTKIMNNKQEHQLEKLREDMRHVTADIIKLVQKRMRIAGEIGDIKNNLMMNIEDITVEQDIARYVNDLGAQVGLKREFIGRLLNLLFLESIRIQKSKHSSKEPKIDHMVMFLKAKQTRIRRKKNNSFRSRRARLFASCKREE